MPRLDGSGITFQSNLIAFQVYNSTSIDGQNGEVLIPYDTVMYNKGNSFSSGQFTAPVSGLYHFNWTAYVFFGAASGGYFDLVFRKGVSIASPGVYFLAHRATAEFGAESITASFDVVLNAGDIIKPFFATPPTNIIADAMSVPAVDSNGNIVVGARQGSQWSGHLVTPS